MSPTTSTVDLSERDNKETLFVKEEVTDDADVFGEIAAARIVNAASWIVHSVASTCLRVEQILVSRNVKVI